MAQSGTFPFGMDSLHTSGVNGGQWRRNQYRDKQLVPYRAGKNYFQHTTASKQKIA